MHVFTCCPYLYTKVVGKFPSVFESLLFSVQVNKSKESCFSGVDVLESLFQALTYSGHLFSKLDFFLLV